ncbi:MAG: hypothetical protein ACLTRS_09945 [Lachnospiraceae bacterium]
MSEQHSAGSSSQEESSSQKAQQSHYWAYCSYLRKSQKMTQSELDALLLVIVQENAITRRENGKIEIADLIRSMNKLIGATVG